MLHKDFPRILVRSCTKCRGALREQADPGEWMCINCGNLVLNKTPPKPLVVTKVKDLVKTVVVEEVVEEVEVEEDSSVTLNRLEEEAEEGDDQEWSKLTNFSKEKG